MRTILVPALAAASAVLVTAATQGGAAPAVPKVPGEQWRQTFSMQMEGMKMPQQTLEYCVPVGKAQERALTPQQDDGKCEVYDVRTMGNRTTAKMRCTGENAMTGEMDVTSEPDHIRGTNRMKSSDGEMVLTFDSRRLGSCMADDPAALERQALAMQQEAERGPRDEQLKACRDNTRNLPRNPGETPGAAVVVLGSPVCRGTDSFRTFCTAVQTHEGFRGLEWAQRPVANQPLPPDVAENPMALATMRPLTASIEACGLGKGDAGASALKTKLLASAEGAGAWMFMVDYGDDAAWTRVRDIVRQNCTGRAYTTATDNRYRNLCLNYGEMLMRNERRPAEGVGNPLNDVAGSTGSTPAAGSAPGSAAPPAPGAQPAEAPADEPSQSAGKQAAKEAVDAGKKLLRGIFGR